MVVTTRVGVLLLLKERPIDKLRCKALDMSNFKTHFGNPSKLASCIIENDLETELQTGNDVCIHVYTTYGGELRELGRFSGSCEFEEWLCSNMPYEKWKQLRMNEENNGS